MLPAGRDWGKIMPESALSAAVPRTPWHLWLAGALSLLWNASGAWVAVQAQTGAAMDMDAAEIAYYAEQPLWVVTLTDLAFVAAILGALALLLRSRWATPLYLLSIAAIIASAVGDIARGSALLLQQADWLTLALITTGLAIMQWLYALWIGKRGALR
jgi:hypothetical protein